MADRCCVIYYNNFSQNKIRTGSLTRVTTSVRTAFLPRAAVTVPGARLDACTKSATGQLWTRWLSATC